jgi:hypothetical protein
VENYETGLQAAIGGGKMNPRNEARWEWRVFSDRPFDALAPLFDRLQPSNRKQNADIYIISPDTDANLKIRNNMLDVKTLLEKSRSGAERWSPVFRCSFPPQEDSLAELEKQTGFKAPAAFWRGNGETEWPRLVRVEKDRSIYVVEKTIIETGTADFCGERRWTLCAEGLDLEQIEYFAQGCGLAAQPVMGYVKMLKEYLLRG